MSGLDKNRLRNQTVCFRATPEERREIEARIKISGIPKGQYYIQSLLHQQINIVVGKYQSDRLSLEIRRLREQIKKIENNVTNMDITVLEDCRAILKQLLELMERDRISDMVTADELKTKK